MNRILHFALLYFSISALSAQEPLKVHFNTTSEVMEGDEFQVEVRLSDFTDIYVMQMFFLWDSTVMEVNEVVEFSEDIPDFDDTMVTLPFQDNARPEKGKLRISWISPNALTIDNDSHLMTLSFTALGMQCDSTQIEINDIGMQQSEIIEVVTSNDVNIGAVADDFIITIPGPDCLTSTDEINDIGFQLYPNPVKDILNVNSNISSAGETLLWLYDVDGKVYLKHFLEQSSKIDLTQLPPANYLYDIQHKGKIIQQGKVVKI